MFKMSHYTQHLPTGALDGSSEYPWYSGQAINSATPLVQPGTLWELTGDYRSGGGNVFMYVRAEDALAAGDIVANPVPVSWTQQATGTSHYCKYTSGNDDKPTKYSAVLTSYPGSRDAQPKVGDLIAVGYGGSNATIKIRTIKEIVYDGSTYRIYWAQRDFTVPATVEGPDVVATAPTGGSDTVQWFRPYHVVVDDIVNTARQTVVSVALPGPIGVALGTVTAGYYTVIQVAGMGLVKCTGSATSSFVDVVANSLATVREGQVTGLSSQAQPTTFWIKSHVATSAAVSLKPCSFDFRHGL